MEQQQQQVMEIQQVDIFSRRAGKVYSTQAVIDTSKPCRIITKSELEASGEFGNMILAADDDPHAHAHVGYLGKVKLSVQSTFHRINDREWYCVVEDDSLPPLTLNKSMQPKKSTEPESEALPIGMQVSKKKKREKAEARKRAKERDRKETELEEEDENQKRKEAREELKREAQGTSQRSAGQK